MPAQKAKEDGQKTALLENYSFFWPRLTPGDSHASSSGSLRTPVLLLAPAAQLTGLCSSSPAQITTHRNFTQVNRATVIPRWPRSSTAKKKGPPVLMYRMVLSWDGALCLLGSAAADCFGLHLVASNWIRPRAANRAISTDPASTDPKASGTKTFEAIRKRLEGTVLSALKGSGGQGETCVPRKRTPSPRGCISYRRCIKRF